MAEKEEGNLAPRFKQGDRVKIRYSRGAHARIAEVRGPIGPGGVQVYRVEERRSVPGTKPIRSYVDVMEDQIELVPAKV